MGSPGLRGGCWWVAQASAWLPLPRCHVGMELTEWGGRAWETRGMSEGVGKGEGGLRMGSEISDWYLGPRALGILFFKYFQCPV